MKKYLFTKSDFMKLNMRSTRLKLAKHAYQPKKNHEVRVSTWRNRFAIGSEQVCKKESNLKKCNCTYLSCNKRGICCECISYHHNREELPGCYFTKEQEKTFDRSIAYFLKCNG